MSVHVLKEIRTDLQTLLVRLYEIDLGGCADQIRVDARINIPMPIWCFTAPKTPIRHPSHIKHACTAPRLMVSLLYYSIFATCLVR